MRAEFLRVTPFVGAFCQEVAASSQQFDLRVSVFKCFGDVTRVEPGGFAPPDFTLPDFDKSFNEGGAISDFQVVSNISISKRVTQTMFSVPLRHVCTKEKTPQREYWSDRG